MSAELPDEGATASAAASHGVTAAPPRTVAPQRFGHYQLRRPLGRGGMGRVFLARDERLGRSVALKLVDVDPTSPGALDRFLTEARVTARFSHPHIVTIYDVGSADGVGFLALEHLDGESLHERAQRAPLTTDEVLRVARAIADALAHAHAHDVLHCDLKPRNVMCPRDGRVRVVDFGLAMTRDGEARRAAMGTADWMAPEQWRGEAIDDRVDVWALAVIVHELACREHPFGPAADRAARRASVLDGRRTSSAGFAALPSPIRALVERSLVLDPAARPPAVEWLRALDGVLTSERWWTDSEGPYRGLSGFGEEHGSVFVGREVEVETFLERLREVPALAVVGPSGVGKSSFLHAGVIPRLRARERWTILSMRPGRAPLATLARRLLSTADEAAVPAAHDVDRLATDLAGSPPLLGLRLATLAAMNGGRVMLVIDQLEELFTQGAPEAEVAAFLAAIEGAVDDMDDPVRVALIVRDDFVGRLETLRHVFVLRSMDASALRRTVMLPLERVGHAFDEPAVVDEMLAEVAGRPGALPLLQFACRALWDARDVERRVLRAVEYRLAGGVVGTLARHGDGALAELGAPERGVARQLLLRLVTAEGTRKIMDRARLLGELPPAGPRVLDRLIDARLVVQRHSTDESTTLVELAHESLVTRWAQLASWLDASREERRLLEALDEAAAFWHRRGRRGDETWGADELAVARRRAAELGVRVPEPVEAFLDAGEARQRELRRRRRLRLAAGVAVALAVSAGSVSLAADFRAQKLEAERQRHAINLAAADVGRAVIVLRVLDPGRDEPVALAELRSLDWSLFRPSATDPLLPGDPIEVHARTPLTSDGVAARMDEVEARSGPAFLRVDGRGRADEACGPAWIYVRAMPGYARRDTPDRVEVWVPSCRGTAHDMVEIPAGIFIDGGPGVPATRFPEDIRPEVEADVPRFAIDRHEVTRAAYRRFVWMEAVTGAGFPEIPAEVAGDDDRLPVVGITAHDAAAYCRWMGKDLPTAEEWRKAARGGVMLGPTAPNPAPRRAFPSGTDRSGATVGRIAPVGSSPADVSPYGVMDLAGNVAEWTASRPPEPELARLRAVLGGGWSAPAELGHDHAGYANAHDARYFDYATGVRCVAR